MRTLFLIAMAALTLLSGCRAARPRPFVGPFRAARHVHRAPSKHAFSYTWQDYQGAAVEHHMYAPAPLIKLPQVNLRPTVTPSPAKAKTELQPPLYVPSIVERDDASLGSADQLAEDNDIPAARELEPQRKPLAPPEPLDEEKLHGNPPVVLADPDVEVPPASSSKPKPLSKLPRNQLPPAAPPKPTINVIPD